MPPGIGVENMKRGDSNLVKEELKEVPILGEIQFDCSLNSLSKFANPPLVGSFMATTPPTSNTA